MHFLSRGGWIFGLALAAMAAKAGEITPPPNALQEQARQALRSDLEKMTGWTKVHAAEVQIDCGLQKEVRIFCLSNSQKNFPIAGYWRVRARLSAKESEQQKHWLHKILRVALGRPSPDRVRALESLAKFKVSLNAEEREKVRLIARSEPRADAIFGWWALAVRQDQEAYTHIVAGLDSEDSKTRLRSAYVLGQLSDVDKDGVRRLVQIAHREKNDSKAYPYLVGSAAKLDRNIWRSVRWRNELAKIFSSGQGGPMLEAAQHLRKMPTEKGDASRASLLNHREPDVRIACNWLILKAGISEKPLGSRPPQ